MKTKTLLSEIIALSIFVLVWAYFDDDFPLFSSEEAGQDSNPLNTEDTSASSVPSFILPGTILFLYMFLFQVFYKSIYFYLTGLFVMIVPAVYYPENFIFVWQMVDKAIIYINAHTSAYINWLPIIELIEATGPLKLFYAVIGLTFLHILMTPTTDKLYLEGYHHPESLQALNNIEQIQLTSAIVGYYGSDYEEGSYNRIHFFTSNELVTLSSASNAKQVPFSKIKEVFIHKGSIIVRTQDEDEPLELSIYGVEGKTAEECRREFTDALNAAISSHGGQGKF